MKIAARHRRCKANRLHRIKLHRAGDDPPPATKPCNVLSFVPKRGRNDMRVFVRGFLAMFAVICVAAAAQAQTRPQVTSLGPDYPKSEIFIGNSFFYSNN